MASRLVQAVLGWGGTVLIARSLDVDEFGRFTLIFTVLGVMSVVTDMGIGRIAVRGMLDEEGRDTSHFAGAYLVLRSIMGVVGYVVAILAVLLLGYPDEVVAATAVAGLVVVLATPSAALDVVFQARMRMGTVSACGVAGLMGQFALTAAIAAAGGSLLLFTIPAVAAQVVVLALKAPVAHRLVPLHAVFDRRLWGSMLREAVPLSLGIGLATVYYRVDAIMLSKLDTFEAVGLYGVSYKFIDIVHFAATAVTVPLLTVLVRSWPDDVTAFRDAARRGAMLLGILGGIAAVGLIGFARPLTDLLYGAGYAESARATQVLVVAQVLTLFASLVLTCLIAVDRHRAYALVTLTGLVLNVGANFVLIPRYSYEGAAWATLGSEVVVLSALILLLRRVPQLAPFGIGRLVVAPVAVAVAVAVGRAADLAVPWVLAAVLAVAVFAAIAYFGGLTSAAGLRGPSRTSRGAA
ncbi:MAG: hypothetical protein JWN84_3748 [Nocardioides sp.]|nr:hypothetical protein [Nocardioides sp.]